MVTPLITSYLDELVYVGSLGCLVPRNSSLPFSRQHYCFPWDNSCGDLAPLKNSFECYFTEGVMGPVGLNCDIPVITAIYWVYTLR